MKLKKIIFKHFDRNTLHAVSYRNDCTSITDLSASPLSRARSILRLERPWYFVPDLNVACGKIYIAFSL